MRTLDSWLAEYGESHQHPTNKAIHWICVPVIFFSVVGLLYAVKLPGLALGELQLTVAHLVLVLAVVYYVRLSVSLAVGLLLFALICLVLCGLIEQYVAAPLWAVCLVLFVAAWVGQFYGHKVEGKKPSFLKDLQFLLIGPAWLMSFLYRSMGFEV